MRCPRCGAVLRDDAVQCGFCGERIGPAVSFEKPIIENRPRDEAFDVENTVRPEVPERQQNHDQNPIVIAIIILSGVLMAAVGVLLFYVFKNSQRAIINVNPTTTEEASQPSDAPSATVQDPAGNADADHAQAAQETEPAAEEAEAEEAAEDGEENGAEPSAVIQTIAFDEREFDGIVYRINGNQAFVIKCQCEEEWIEIPATVYDVPVIGISEDAFNGCAHLQYIDLPEGVAWIGARAFMNCTNLREIVMPDTMVTVGDGTFNYCPAFTIVSHETAYGRRYADEHDLNWLEGDSLVPMD